PGVQCRLEPLRELLHRQSPFAVVALELVGHAVTLGVSHQEGHRSIVPLESVLAELPGLARSDDRRTAVRLSRLAELLRACDHRCALAARQGLDELTEGEAGLVAAAYRVGQHDRWVAASPGMRPRLDRPGQ